MVVFLSRNKKFLSSVFIFMGLLEIEKKHGRKLGSLCGHLYIFYDPRWLRERPLGSYKDCFVLKCI